MRIKDMQSMHGGNGSCLFPSRQISINSLQRKGPKWRSKLSFPTSERERPP